MGGALSGKPKTNTSTSSTTPTLTPEMQELMKRLTEFSTESMQNPQAGFAPIRTAAVDNVNRNYSKVGSRLNSSFAQRGYGSSGALGEKQFDTEMARGGDLSNIEAQFAKSAIDQKNFGAGLGQNLLNFGRGSKSEGTSTTPDTSLGDAFMSGGNALENLSGLLSFNNYTKALLKKKEG